MRRIDPIDMATAEKLVNFRGRGDSAFSFARRWLVQVAWHVDLGCIATLLPLS